MKDMRASCLEPVNVLSEYKWQGGLGYYETTKDASTNFFFGASIKERMYLNTHYSRRTKEISAMALRLYNACMRRSLFRIAKAYVSMWNK